MRDVQVEFRNGDGVMALARPVIGGFALPDAARVSIEGSVPAHIVSARIADDALLIVTRADHDPAGP